MIPKAAIDIIVDLWPILFLCIITTICLKVAYSLANCTKLELYKEMINLVFIAYVIMLFSLVTATDFSSFSNNFVPFKEILRYNMGSRLFFKNVVGNMVMFLPYGIQYISNSFMQINDSLFNAGRVCGAKKFYLTIKIILPLIFKGILFGWMMIFIIVFRELVASSLVSPLGTRTISTYIVSQFNQGEVGVGMAMAVVCVLISTSALILLNIFSNKSVKYEKNK